MWQIQLALCLFTVYLIFLSSLTPCKITSFFHPIGSTDLHYPSPAAFWNCLDIAIAIASENRRRFSWPISSSSSSVICQTTGPKPLPKRFLHIVRSRASSFNWQYPLLSLRPSSSFLRLLPRLLVTSICPFIFPSITCCRRQFLRKIWPIQLAFRFLISCRIFLCSLTVSNTSSLTDTASFIPYFHFHSLNWIIFSFIFRRHIFCWFLR